MANTSFQLEIEDWVRREWLPRELGQPFFRERLRLRPGGVFDFDAVSADPSIAATISTSMCLTAGGKLGVGKTMKIRSDIYFLLLADSSRRIAVFTQSCMFEWWQKEASIGRVPSSIEFMLATLPADLAVRLESSRRVSSDEVRPIRG